MKSNKIQFDTWDDFEKCKQLQKRFGDYDEFKVKPNKENKISIFESMNGLLDEHKGNLELLEVGCGPGHFLWVFKDKVSKIIGFDYSPHMLKLAEEQFKKATVESEFIQGSCWSLPFDDNFVDISLQVDVCMHIGGSWDSIKEMIRVSRKYVVFTGPSFESFKGDMDKRIGVKSWAVNVPLLEKELDKLITSKEIKSYAFLDRTRSKTYTHKILLVKK